MSALDSRLDAILADPLAQARAAGRALGYVGCDVPAELLIGSRRFACHLPWDADRKTPTADRWIERSFAPWARSMLECWADGELDCFDCVIFSRGDDSAHRLYYYVCELQRRGQIGGPAPLIFDVAKLPRATSLEHTVTAVQRLAERLDIGDQGMRDAIEDANRKRRLYADVEARRQGPGRLHERLARASLFADIDALLRTEAFPQQRSGRRVLLAGSAPPDDRLHAAIEVTGWIVAGEWHERTLRRLGPEHSADTADPVAAVGRHAHGLAVGTRSFLDRAIGLVDAARSAHADAVVLWLIEEDEALTWSVPAQRAALAAAGVPALIATRRRWDARDGIAEDIAAFLAAEGRR